MKETFRQSAENPPSMDARVERGLWYLERTFRPGRGFTSFISAIEDFAQKELAPDEVFTQVVAMQALLDVGLTPSFLPALRELVESSSNEEGLVHFFLDKSLLIPDMDCTAVAHAMLVRAGWPSSRLARTIDLIVSNTTSDGIIEVYARPAGEHSGRVDPFVLANVLYLLHQTDREDEARASRALVIDTLLTSRYLHGSRYYPSPEAFLYFLSRLPRDFERTRAWLLAPLRTHLLNRQGAPGSSFDRALRVAASDNVGLTDAVDLAAVAHAQRADGSWAPAPFFSFGRTKRYFGSRALSTALALRAMRAQSVGCSAEMFCAPKVPTWTST